MRRLCNGLGLKASCFLLSAFCLPLIGCGGGSGASTETFTVPSPSMAPTYRIGMVLRVDKSAYAKSAPQRGDVVVVHAPQGAERNVCGVPSEPGDGHPCSLPAGGESDIQLVKRVVAVGGDRVRIVHNRVYVNGSPQSEPYARVADCGQGTCDLPNEIVVPPGDVFVMGDNRAASVDSRVFGPLPAKWIVGRVQDVVG